MRWIRQITGGLVRSPGIQIPAAYGLLILLCISGCAKEPGVGGRAEIHGRIMEQDHSNSGVPRGEPYPRAGRRVYISYNEQPGNDDDVRSGPDGRFRFPWLRKGTYHIHTFGECLECPGGSVAVSRVVEITGRKDIVDIGDLLIDNF